MIAPDVDIDFDLVALRRVDDDPLHGPEIGDRTDRAAGAGVVAPLSDAQVDLFGAQGKGLGPLRDKVGFTQKAGCKFGRRAFIKFFGCADLFDGSVTHDHDPVRHRQRFFLIMGHVDKRRADAAVDVLELFLHFDAQLFVKRTKRFVQKQHRRRKAQGTRKGDTLLLPPGQLRRLAICKILQLHQLQHLVYTGLDLGRGFLAHAQRIADIVAHRHMRE